MKDKSSPDSLDYVPDERLSKIYSEANDLDEHGLSELCPAYSELAAVKVRYCDEVSIGKGGLKEVYKIYDQHLQRWVAMARLREDRGPDFYDLFVREARLIATLSHPNIIKIYNMGVSDDDRPFFTMDLKSNTTLGDLIKPPEQVSLNQLLRVFGKVGDAINYAHSRGVLHLDLKPENIQVDDFGEVLVCDWGNGKMIAEVEFEETGAEASSQIWGDLTLVGQIKGSPGYMSPEQVVEGSVKDQRADIYALGCILHFLLTGQPPFTGDREEVLSKTAESIVPSLRRQFPEKPIPASLEAVVLKATALNPEDRYQSVGQLQAEVENYLSGFSTHAEKPGMFREALLFAKRNLLLVTILASSLFVIGLTTAWFTKHLGQQKIATATEKERVETLSSKHSSYIEDALEAKKKLAVSLAVSARKLRDHAIYERPVETLKLNRRMVETALQQDPDCVYAHAQHFATDCVELNYNAALKRPAAVRSVSSYSKYYDLAEAFPTYDFSANKRPSIQQLTEFFNQARPINNLLSSYFERVLAYDFATRKDKTGYHSVIEAFLQYQYQGADHIKLTLTPENSGLTIWANQAVSLRGQYGECVLRFLSFRSLELDISGQFDLSDLNGLPIEFLDLSRCQKVSLSAPVSLPQLKKVTVDSGQTQLEQIRHLLQTNDPVEILSKSKI